jgi:hypothetical protein
MGFSLKSISFRPKTSEQIKNRHVLKLNPEKPTKLNRNGQPQIFILILIAKLSYVLH